MKIGGGGALTEAVKNAAPDASIHSFSDEGELMAFAGKHIFQVVFFQIDGAERERLELAEKRLLRLIPGINLIIAAATDKYLREALRLHASGYIAGDPDADKVRAELDNLLYPLRRVAHLTRDKSGMFRISIDGEPIRFKYSKTKELLSILLENSGRMCSTRWLVEYLWGDGGEGVNTRSYFQNLRVDLKKTLAEYEMDHMLISRRGEMGIDMRAFEPEEV